MSEFFSFFILMWQRLIGSLESVRFDVFGIDASLFQILIGFILLSIVIGVFWKGARG